jgi:hypothetical protein
METKQKFDIRLLSWIASGILLVLAVVFYVVFGSFGIPTRVTFVLAALAVIGAGVVNRDDVVSFFRRGGTITGITRIIQFAVIALLLVFVYLLSDSLPFRIDLTSSRLYTLSDETKMLLRQVTNDMRVISFKPAGMQGPLVEYQQGLLKAYAERNPKIKLEVIDPQVNRGAALDYDIKDDGTVVFEYQGNRIQRPINAIVQNDQQSGKTIFQGEIVYTGVLKDLLASKPKDIYVLVGHGELSPGAKGNSGYNEIFEKLQAENARLHALDLTRSPVIPAGCSLLFIGNPVRPIPPGELDLIRNFIEDGGSVLVSLEFETTPLINDIIREAGLFSLPSMIIEGEYYNPQLGQSVIMPKILGSEITMPLIRGQLPVVMRTARAVQQLPESERESNATYFLYPLLKTSDNSFGETDEAEIRSGRFRQTPKDLKGPMFAAYAARRVIQNVMTTRTGSETNTVESRLVVFGDCDFFNNAYSYIGGNSDLFINSVNWLLKREGSITIRPKTSEVQGFELGSAERRFMSVLAFALGLLYFVPGVVYVLRRRSKVKG